MNQSQDKRGQDPSADSEKETSEPGRREREYGHSSGDRNSRHERDEWKSFEGGEQREASPDRPPVK